MTQLGIEARSPGPLANTLTIIPMGRESVTDRQTDMGIDR